MPWRTMRSEDLTCSNNLGISDFALGPNFARSSKARSTRANPFCEVVTSSTSR